MKHEFTIPLLPPSMNAIYGYNPMTKRRYLNSKGRTFKAQCKLFVPPIELEAQTPVKIQFSLYGNWFYKNGNIKKHDGQNLSKILYDAIFEKVGVDDCCLWKWSGEKIQSDESKTVVKFETIEKSKICQTLEAIGEVISSL